MNKNLEFIKKTSSEISEIILKNKEIYLSEKEVEVFMELIKLEINTYYQSKLKDKFYFEDVFNTKGKKTLFGTIKETYFG